MFTFKIVMPEMPYQLWFQFNSSKKEQFQNCNKPLIDFLKSRMTKLIPIIKESIKFQLVDTSKPDDIKQAQAKGIKSLPALISNGNVTIGLTQIEKFIDQLITRGVPKKLSRPNGEDDIEIQMGEDDNISRPNRKRTDDEDEIESMWRSEIVENSDDEDMGDDDANDRIARAEAMTERRKALAERHETGGKRRGKQQQSKPKRPPVRTHRNTPQGNAGRRNDDTDDDQPGRPRQKAPPMPDPPEEPRRQRKKTNVEHTPSEITRSLGGHGEQAQEDALMSKFWDNQEQSAY